MIELVSQPGTEPTIRWWCADCAAVCSALTEDEEACADCGSDLLEQLPEAWSASSAVRVVADFHRQEGVELEDAAGALLPLIRTPEDLCRWLAVVVGSPGAELDCARHLSLENELQEVAQHLLSELGESEARLGRLEAWVREQALVAGLPLVVTTAAERVVHLSPQELVLALGEAAARGREAPTPAPLVGTFIIQLDNGTPVAAPGRGLNLAHQAAPALTSTYEPTGELPCDPTADALGDVFQERARQVVRWGRQHHRRDITNFSLCLTPGQREPQPDAELASRVGELRALVQAQAASPWGSAWSCILLKEVAEAFEAAQDMLTGSHPPGISDRTKLRNELVQVAAVAIAWVEALDEAPDAAPESFTGALIAAERERDRLSAEVEGHQAAARRAVGLLQRTAGALRALDAEVQAGSWRGAEQHLGAPLSDQTLRGLADHLEGELRRTGGRA